MLGCSGPKGLNPGGIVCDLFPIDLGSFSSVEISDNVNPAVLIGVALGPTVIAAVVEINTTTLAGVPLASVIILLGTYLPAFYYLAIVLGGIAMVWAATRSGNH